MGEAVLSYITSNHLVARSAELGAQLHERAQQLLELPIVGDVRGRGMLLGVENVADQETRRPFPRNVRVCETITDRAFANGLVTCPISGVADGVDGDATVFKPGANHSQPGCGRDAGHPEGNHRSGGERAARVTQVASRGVSWRQKGSVAGS